MANENRFVGVLNRAAVLPITTKHNEIYPYQRRIRKTS